MIVDAPAEFWDWFSVLAESAAKDDQQARHRHDLALALLMDLYDLRSEPDSAAETATFSKVREAKRHPVWRLSAQLEPGSWVRVLCAFPPGTGAAVIACPTGDLSRIGDPFYRTISGRTDALVEHWLGDKAAEGRRVARGLTRGFESADEYIALAMASSADVERIGALRRSLRAREKARTSDMHDARRMLHTQIRGVRV